MQTLIIPPELGGGEARSMGCLPMRPAMRERFPVFGSDLDDEPLIPRDKWVECDWSHFITEIDDQDSENACNAFGSVQALHACRARAGLPYVKLSAGNLYGRINGGRDMGSYCGDSIVELMTTGVCKASTVPMLEWHPSRWPSNWKQEAARFKILEAWMCPTFDHVASAIQRGYDCDGAVNWKSYFEPDADGFVIDKGGKPGGHAICSCGLVRFQNKWWMKFPNSWGLRWGKNGFGYVCEDYFGGPYGMWTVRAAVDPSGEE